MNRATPFLLTAGSALLGWLAWPAGGFAPLLFLAWIPLLVLEDRYFRAGRSRGLFGWVYLSFFLWNLLTTWWVYNSSLFGVVAAVLCNSLFMALVFMLFHQTRKKVQDTFAYPALIAYWLSFEYLHLNWDISWPWLTLGNGLATMPRWIQWYEYTGILGGSLWILALNIMLYRLLFFAREETRKTKSVMVAALLLIPVACSLTRYHTYEETPHPVNITVVQPNIDPYHEKFGTLSARQQLIRLLQLAASKTDSAVDYLVAPETAMVSGMWEEELHLHPDVGLLRKFMGAFPGLRIVIGASTYRQYPDSTQRSSTARRFTKSEGYYDSFNTALFLDTTDSIQVHHKSKLVPGVEKMPYPRIFGFLEKFAIDLGGISGSLGKDPERMVFRSGEHVAAPIICYESVYGEYVADYVRKNADLLFIITNDGWWGHTPGHRQHLQYGRLRAIEMRRSIARSANTGISCFINQRGDILQPTKYWEEDVISATINASDKVTFYARYGDYLAKAGLLYASAMLILVMIRRRGDR